MLPVDDPWNDRLLKRTEVPPAQTVDDVVLQGRMDRSKWLTGRARFHQRSNAHGLPFDLAQLRVTKRQRIVGTRVEILELVDPIQEFADELLEEDRGATPIFPPSLPATESARLAISPSSQARRTLSAAAMCSQKMSRMRNPPDRAWPGRTQAGESGPHAGYQNELPSENRHADVAPGAPTVASPEARRKTPECR